MLFADPILSVKALAVAHEDHASDVWAVCTRAEDVVVRTSRRFYTPETDFLWGVRRLFGAEPRDMERLSRIHARLRRLTDIPVPRVLRTMSAGGRSFAVVERLEGDMPASFTDLPDDSLVMLGAGLARIHRDRRAYLGDAGGLFLCPAPLFHARMANVMCEALKRFHSYDEELVGALPAALDELRGLPDPKCGVPTLFDFYPGQFLIDREKRLAGLVDLEMYVVAPPEMDFVNLEFLVGGREAERIAHGYRTVAPLPRIGPVRGPYRFFGRLLGVHGDMPVRRVFDCPARWD